jgi:hypothetical protein
MKLKVMVLAIILSFSLVFASPFLDWGRVYQKDGSQQIYYVTAGFNGIYLVGSTSDSPYNESVLAMKIDEDGNVLYERVLNESPSDWGIGGFETFDDNFMVVGTTKASGMFYDFYLAKLGADEFRKPIKNFGTDKATAAIEFVDGYYILGHSTDPQSLNSRGRLIKIDKETHEIILDAWLPNFKPGIDVNPLSIELTADGNFIIVGTIINYFTSGSEFYMTKVNLKGEEIWTKVFNGKDMNYSRGFQVAEAEDGYIAVGFTGSWKNGWSDVYLVKYDFDGNLLWERILENDGSDRGYSVKIAKDGKIYVAGYTTREGNRMTVLYEFDHRGFLLNEHLLGGTGLDVIYSMDICNDGNLYLAGFTTSKEYNVVERDVIVLKYSF